MDIEIIIVITCLFVFTISALLFTIWLFNKLVVQKGFPENRCQEEGAHKYSFETGRCYECGHNIKSTYPNWRPKQ